LVNVRETIAAAGQRRPFTILGVMIALLTLASFVFVASGAGNNAVPAQVQAGLLPVVVAKTSIKARSPITAADLEVKRLAAQPVGGFSKISDVGIGSAKFALIDIPAGQPLVSNGIASVPADPAATAQPFINIPSGYIATTIPTSEQQGVAGSIRSGDYIGIVAVLDLSGQTIAKTVFTNVRVLQTGVGSTDIASQLGPLSNKASTSGAQTLTVLMTQCDAEYLNWFLARAALRYTLESAKDYPTGAVKPSNCTVDEAKGVTSADIAARFGIK